MHCWVNANKISNISSSTLTATKICWFYNSFWGGTLPSTNRSLRTRAIYSESSSVFAYTHPAQLAEGARINTKISGCFIIYLTLFYARHCWIDSVLNSHQSFPNRRQEVMGSLMDITRVHFCCVVVWFTNSVLVVIQLKPSVSSTANAQQGSFLGSSQ